MTRHRSSIASATPSPPRPQTGASEVAGGVEVWIRVRSADAEAVAGLLGVLVPGGAAIDYGNPAHPPAQPTVHAWFAQAPAVRTRRALRRRLTALPLSAPLPPLRYRAVEQRDWSQEWKRFFDIQRVGERLVIRPSWKRYDRRPGELVIDLDPGQGFGTGQHPSTRLALRALERHVRPGGAVIDVGTGSGILAIAAARLGAAAVLALDTDGVAVGVARENAARNAVIDVVRVAEQTLDAGAHRGAADVVVANISAVVLEETMECVASTLRGGGRFIGSGFLASDERSLAESARAAGLVDSAFEVERDGDATWSCIVAHRA